MTDQNPTAEARRRLTPEERAQRQRAATTAWRRKRKAKPYDVWPSDRDDPIMFATFEAAEAYAKKALRRTGEGYIYVEHHIDGIAATVRQDDRDVIVTDLTDVGAAV